MSALTKGIGLLSVVGYGGSKWAQHQFPPTGGTQYKPGDKYITRDGRERVFLGYSGHEESVINQGIRKTRPLWLGNKQVAQNYAKMRGENGAVGHVIGDKLPTRADYGYAGTKEHVLNMSSVAPELQLIHPPLSPVFMQRANVELIEPEKVTSDTEIGAVASLKRALDAVQNLRPR